MARYSKSDLDKEARRAARGFRKEHKDQKEGEYPYAGNAKAIYWEIIINSDVCLQVHLDTGHIINVAI